MAFEYILIVLGGLLIPFFLLPVIVGFVLYSFLGLYQGVSNFLSERLKSK